MISSLLPVILFSLNSTPFIIAIDGTSGAGKSSTARALAARMRALYVDTGAHYRAVTMLLQRAGVPYTQPEAIEHTLAHWTLDEEIVEGASHILLNHKRFDEMQLRTEAINSDVSYYAAVSVVRKFLFHFQRSQQEVAQIEGFPGLVMEGRDIGLNIFPHTPYKYFFVADPKIRAERRAKEGLLDATDARDLVDSTQGQLRKALDAKQLDTSKSTPEEIVEWLWKDVTTKLNKRD